MSTTGILLVQMHFMSAAGQPEVAWMYCEVLTHTQSARRAARCKWVGSPHAFVSSLPLEQSWPKHSVSRSSARYSITAAMRWTMWTGHQSRFSLVCSWSDVARVIGELTRYVARNALVSCRNFGKAGLGKGTNRAPAIPAASYPLW